MNIDDPKLTAFALDELDEPERSTIARGVADSPEARRYVEETRELSRALKNGFAADLQSQRPQTRVRRAPMLIDIHDDAWFWSIGRPLAIAATIAIFALLAAIAIGTYKSRSNSNPPVAVDYEPIEGEQGPGGASEFSGPATVANPLRIGTIDRIERVVIGELNGDPHLEDGELRLIEIINDAYRIERLKQRLKVPVLSKQSHRTLGNRGYGLIFLDRGGRILATARFCRLPQTGFVLQPLQNAYERDGRYFLGRGEVVPGAWKSDVDYSGYAIAFPDWNECVGYAPNA